jgi:flavin-dependent dehydrogenase
MTLAATLTLGETARRTWGAVVVGAGPAGAMAARELARRSIAVLLVDRASFPRWKVCGCCLSGRALAILHAAGLGSLPVMRRAVPLRGILLAAGARRARVPLSGGAALSREAFDAALVEAAIDAGAAFLPQTSAELLGAEYYEPRPLGSGNSPARLQARVGSQPRRLRFRQGEQTAEVIAQVVIAADGLGGRLLARTGAAAAVEGGARIGAAATTAAAPDFYCPGVIYMTCGAAGYTGLVRLEDGRLEVAAAFDAVAMRAAGGPAGAAARLLREAGWPAPERLEDLPWRGTPPLTRRPRRPTAERIFAVGDAAGYVEPFTGEGMAWALASGAAVAPLAARAADRWEPELARRWAELHARNIGRRQHVCRAAAAVLRRPWLTKLVVRLLAHAPVLAGPVVRSLGR